MRFLLTAFALLPSVALADTILIDTNVTEVTMHPNASAIRREATFEIPEGWHELVLLGVPQGANTDTLRVSLTGASVRGIVYRDDFAPPQDYSNPEVEAAEQAIDDIEAKIRDVQDQAAQARLAGRAAQSTLGFLDSLGRNEGLANASPETLRDIARMISQEALSAGQSTQAAETEARKIEEQLELLGEELAKAQAALRAVQLEDEDRLYVTVDAVVPEAADGTVTLSYLVGHESNWGPVYDLKLTTEDTPKVEIKRDAAVWQNTGENWENVALSLTTVPAVARTESIELHPQGLRIRKDIPVAKLSSRQSYDAALAEPVVEAPVIAEEGRVRHTSASSIGVTYTFSDPVSVASGADVLQLELDSLTLDAELIATATPRHDKTAYRVARVTNSTGEELLPSGTAMRHVNGVITGASGFAGVMPGEEIEIGFGPIKGLRLSRDVLDQTEGDRGIISRSNQQVERVEIEIENLTSEAWPVRLRDRVPYSEQEDLEIDWTADPRPDDINVDKQRGILEWQLDVKPGQTRRIRLDTSLNWPDGMVLQ